MEALKLLKAEIANKRKQLTDLGVVEPDKKFFKQAELNEKLDEEARKLASASSRRDDEASRDSAASKPGEEEGTSSAAGNTASTSSSTKHHIHLPRKEVVRRLRELNQPIRLFGESDDDVLVRLKDVESNIGESVKGMRNDLQQALQKVDDEYLKELMGADAAEQSKTSSSTDKSKSMDLKTYGRESSNVTLNDMAEEAKGKFGKGNNEFDLEFMIRFFKHIIGGWAEELNARPLEVKQSQQGRLDTAIHTQTVEYMKPFLKKLSKNSRYAKRDVLGMDIIESIVDIVKHLLDRNYLKAHEAYLLCAVGNAPWPIGATMVGIHARPGREKLSSKNIAHVMNNETHRKFITGVKRLMARCQKLYPTDPSRSVNFDSHEKK